MMWITEKKTKKKKTSEKHNYAQSMDPKLINVIKSVTF